MRRSGTGLLAWVFACVVLATPAFAQKSIRVESNGHRGAIWDVAYSRDGRYLVSASDDKTARVWDTTTGQTRLVIRGEIGEGDHGKLYAAAISKDGNSVALAGQLASGPPFGDIRLVDIATGEQTARLQGHRGIVFDLAFSPAGSLLASAGSDRKALIWSYPDRKVTATLDHGSAYPERVAFLGEHHVVTIANDGKIRVFDSAGGPAVSTLTMPARPNSLAASGDGGLFAVGDQSGNVRIWTWPDADVFSEFKVGAAVTALSFGAGRRATELAVGTGDAPYAVSLWDTFKGRKLASYGGLDNIIKAVTFSPDGTFVASAGGNQNRIDIWDPQQPEKARTMLGGGGRSVWGVGFLRTPQGNNDSGTYVAWGYEDPCPGVASCPEKPGKLEFAIRLPDERISHLGSPLEIKDRQIISPSGKGVDFTETQAILELQGARLARTVAPDDDERWPELKVERSGSATVVSARDASKGRDHYAYSFLPDGSAVVSGGRNGVFEILSTRDQTVIHDLAGHEGDIAAVAVSPEGVYVASGSNDQTLRLWSATSGELVLSFLQLPPYDWVAWTPQGYYNSSADGDKGSLVGLLQQQGPEKEALYIPFNRLKSSLYRPDVISRALYLGSATEALREAQLDSDVLSDLRKGRAAPPMIRVVNATLEDIDGTSQLAITLFVEPNPSDPLERFEVFVNGVKVSPRERRSGADYVLSVPLFGGDNSVRISAHNNFGQTTVERYFRLENLVGALDAQRKHGSLYLISIGVDDYPNVPPRCAGLDGKFNASCNLEYAAADAKAIAEAVESRLGPHFRSVVKRVLTSGSSKEDEPTRANIEDVMDSLRHTTDADTVIVFIAGHGESHPRDGYLFLTTDAAPGSGGWASSTVIKWQQLEGYVQNARSRRMLFVDTCRAANAYNARLIKDASEGEIAAFSATNRQQDSEERTDLGHGVFTFALLRALRGEADMSEDGLRVFDLGQFLWREVRRLTDGRQTPDFYKNPGAENFVIVQR